MGNLNLGPVVLDGRLRYSSPSQLERADPESEGGCERKWWLRYVARLEEKRRAATDLGTQMHAQIEHYLRTGQMVLGALARQGALFIPRPGSDLKVESEWGCLRGVRREDHPVRGAELPAGWVWPDVSSPVCAGDVPLNLKIDLMHMREVFLDEEGALRPDPGTFEVRDWKSTSQIDDVVDPKTGAKTRTGWAKKGPDLADTWQMLAYAKVGKSVWPAAERARLSHGYFQTKNGRDAALRTTVLPAARVDELWDVPAARLGERLRSLAATRRVEDVPANYKSCQAFGGCPFKASCPRDPKVVLAEAFARSQWKTATDDRFEERKMGILDRVKKKPAGEPSSAAMGVGAAGVDPVVAAEMTKLEAEAAAATNSVAPPDQPMPSATHEPLPPGEQAPAEAQAGEPCPSSGDQVELTPDEIAAKKRACVCGAELKVKPQKLPDGKWYGQVPDHAVGEAPAAAKRGRPKKAEAPAEMSPAYTEADSTHPSAAGMAQVVALRGVHLFKDAIEDETYFTRLESYAAELAAGLAAEYGAADVRCAPNDSPLSFGKWKGALAALVRSSPPAPGWYAVSGGDELGMVAFDTLSTMKLGRVVRGVK